ncbi:MAG: hypothetical protein ACR2J5_10060 [Geodermatophilaceae bacterium]
MPSVPSVPYGLLARVSADRLAYVAALDNDPVDLGPTNRLEAQGLGQCRAERVGEEPVGVCLRLPEGDEATEVRVARKRPRRRMVLETEVRTGDEVAARSTATMQELSEAFVTPG